MPMSTPPTRMAQSARRHCGRSAQAQHRQCLATRTLESIAPPCNRPAWSMASRSRTWPLRPTADDAANKAYVDSVAQGLDAKESVRFATTGNIALTGNVAVDGSSTSPGQRVLVKDQTNPNENGIYVTAAGAWSRAPDADAWAELPEPSPSWSLAAPIPTPAGSAAVDAGGTIGSTPITWVQFSAAGQIVAGAGLIKTGNTLDVGAGAGLVVGADSIVITNNGVTNAMLADGAVNLATADVTGTLPVTNGGTGVHDQRRRANRAGSGWLLLLGHAQQRHGDLDPTGHPRPPCQQGADRAGAG